MLFRSDDKTVTVASESRNRLHEIKPLEVPANFTHMANRAEDIAAVRGMGMMVDDDNEPAPENIPDETEKDPKENEKMT